MLSLFSKSNAAAEFDQDEKQSSDDRNHESSIVTAINRSQAVIEFNCDGTIRAANQNFLHATGYQLEEIVGQHHRMFVDSAYAESYEYRTFWNRLAAGEFVSGEFKRFNSQGNAIWIQASYNPMFDESGRVNGVIKFASDITAQKANDLDNRGQIESIHRSYAVIEFELDGTIRDANDNFLKTMGYTLAEVKGKHHRMFVDAKYAASGEYRQFWHNIGRGEFQSGEYERIDKQGNSVWIQATYNPILDDEGRVFKCVKFAVDVTDEVNSKEQIGRIGSSLAEGTSQMTTTIDEISDNLSRAAKLASDSEAHVQSSTEVMDRLQENSHSIGEVTAVIQDLADQTNLLALNATIEAARAGESGRGFAVVASEVKELARQTGDATRKIDGTIQAIQESVGEVAGSMKKISHQITEVSGNTSTVAASIEEQSVTMSELSQSTNELTELANR